MDFLLFFPSQFCRDLRGYSKGITLIGCSYLLYVIYRLLTVCKEKNVEVEVLPLTKLAIY